VFRGNRINSKLRYISLRQILGLILCGAGGYLIYLAVEGFKKITEAKDFATRFSNFFEHNPAMWNPLIKFFGGKAQEKISESQVPASLTLATGIALVVIGVAMVLFYRNKTSR
jgi:hypothetical protein